MLTKNKKYAIIFSTINFGDDMYPYTLFLDVDLYTIALSLAIIAALLLCDKLTQKRGFSIRLQKLVIVAIFCAVVLGIGSAVLFQALYDFLKTGVFKLDSSTGMTFLGGLIGGTLVYLGVWFIGGKLFLKGDNQSEEKRKFKENTEKDNEMKTGTFEIKTKDENKLLKELSAYDEITSINILNQDINKYKKIIKIKE